MAWKPIAAAIFAVVFAGCMMPMASAPSGPKTETQTKTANSRSTVATEAERTTAAMDARRGADTAAERTFRTPEHPGSDRQFFAFAQRHRELGDGPGIHVNFDDAAIRWQNGTAEPTEFPRTEISAEWATTRIEPGGRIALTVTASNHGRGPIHRLIGLLTMPRRQFFGTTAADNDNGGDDDDDDGGGGEASPVPVILGTLLPGETVTRRMSLPVTPLMLLDIEHEWVLDFTDQFGFSPLPIRWRHRFQAAPTTLKMASDGEFYSRILVPLQGMGVLPSGVFSSDWRVKIGADDIVWWAEPPPSELPAPRLEIHAYWHAPQMLRPGDDAELHVRIKNHGPGWVHHVLAMLDSDPIEAVWAAGRALDWIVLGCVPPGGETTRVVRISATDALLREAATFSLIFTDRFSQAPVPYRWRHEFRAAEPVQIGYSSVWEEDAGAGNGDNILQPGETGTLIVSLVNTSSTVGEQLTIKFALPADPYVVLRGPGEFRVSRLLPTEAATVRVLLGTKARFAGDALNITMTVADGRFGKQVETVIRVPVNRAMDAEVVRGNWRLIARTSNTPILSAPQDGARILATVPMETTLEATGILGDWFRIVGVETTRGEPIPGWLHAQHVTLFSASPSNLPPFAAAERPLPPHDDPVSTTPHSPDSAPLPSPPPPRIVVPATLPPPSIAPIEPALRQMQVGAEIDRIALTFALFSAVGLADYAVSVNGRPVVEAPTRAAIAGARALPSHEGARTESDGSAAVMQTTQRHQIAIGFGDNLIRLDVRDTDGQTAHFEWNVTRAAQLGTTFFVAIGVSEYQHHPALPFAAADAEAMHRTFTEIGGVSGENARLLRNPGRAEILAALVWLRDAAVRPFDTVILYYSGHGQRIGSHYFLVPADATAELELSGVEAGQLARLWGAISASRKVFVADSCHAEGFRLRDAIGGGVVDFRRSFAGDGRALFLAAGEDQEAIEASPDGHGLFTKHVLLGLRGAADGDADGIVTVAELKAYLDVVVERDAADRFQKRQTPFIQISGTGALPLTRPGR